MAQQWYNYPLDAPGGGYGQIPEPLNHSYLKPDTNIAVPTGVPITSWDSGVITDVSNKGSNAGGLSVTQRLNHPPNSSALYASFNYLGSSSVHVGQVIQPGAQIGVAGSPTGINFALALGNTPSWGSGNFPQARGDQLYNPHLILDSLRSGNTNFMVNLASSTVSVGYVNVSQQVHQIVNNVPGFVGIVDALDTIEQFQLPNFQNITFGDLPDLPANLIQDTLGFFLSNLVAFAIRTTVMGIALAIIIALILNAAKAAPGGEEVLSGLAQKAAVATAV